MSKQKKQSKTQDKKIKIILGIIFILFAIYGLINYTIPSTAFTFVFVFFFGNLYFLFYGFIIYAGIAMIYKAIAGKKLLNKVFLFIAIALLSISLLICLTPKTVNNQLVGFYNFYDIFISNLKFNGHQPVTVFNSNYPIGGGIVGYFIVGGLNSIFDNSTICIVVESVLFSLSIIFFLYYPIKLLVNFIKSPIEKNKFKKAKAASEVNEKVLQIEQVEEDYDFNNEYIEDKKEEEILEAPVNQSISINEEISHPSSEFKSNEPIYVKKDEEEVISYSKVETKVTLKEEIKEKRSETPEVKKPIFNNFNSLSNNNNTLSKPSFAAFGNMMVKQKEENTTPTLQEAIIINSNPNPSLINEEKFEQMIEKETIEEIDIEEDIIEEFEEDIKEEINETSYEDEIYENENEENYDEISISIEDEKELLNERINEYLEEVETTSNKQITQEFYEQEIASKEVHNNLKSQETNNKKIKYIPPSIDLLDDRKLDQSTIDENKVINDERLNIINQTFEDLDVKAKAISYTIGPSVTRFDIIPDKNIMISSVEKAIDNVSQRLFGLGIRFEKVVVGKSTSAIEIPNESTIMVGFKETFQGLKPAKPDGDLLIPIGKGIDGNIISGDLKDFVHLLISGTTGSGKSIFVHGIIVALLLRNSFEHLKLLIIDPKLVEFTKYDKIPHLLCPVITEPYKAKLSLDRLVKEMNDRLLIFKNAEVSNLKEYNEYAIEFGLPIIPRIVAIIDEYADLCMNEKTIAVPVQTLVQKSRAAGIHLILSMQRPSAEILNGAIKSNISSRVALAAASSLESRIVLDQSGAEKLLGNGDLLVSSSTISRNGLIRVQGPFLSNLEIKRITTYLKTNYEPQYDSTYVNLRPLEEFSSISSNDQFVSTFKDELYDEVKDYAFKREYVSQSQLVAEFSVGYARASKLMKYLKNDGIIEEESKATKGNKVLIHCQEELDDIKQEQFENSNFGEDYGSGY